MGADRKPQHEVQHREGFAQAMALVSAGVGIEVTKLQAEVYYELLGDIPMDVFRLAAKRAVLEHRYHTLPPVGLLRELAVEIMEPRELEADEAWARLRGAMSKICYTMGAEQVREIKATVPALARQVADRIGWNQIRDGKPEVVRGQFLRLYDSARAKVKRAELLPPKLAAEIQTVARHLAITEEKNVGRLGD
jgi:hypothetical protein